MQHHRQKDYVYRPDPRALVEVITTGNPETRRKAALDILRMCGLEPGKHEAFAWGIGPTFPEKVMEKKAENAMWDELMSGFGLCGKTTAG